MRLGSDCELNGNLVVAGDVSFAGRLHGHIRATGDVQIAATARIGGSVRGTDVRLAGLVEGDVISTGVLTLERSGRILGEVYADSICIEPGANLDGPVHLGGTAAARGEAAFTRTTNLDASSSTVRVHRYADETTKPSGERQTPGCAGKVNAAGNETPISRRDGYSGSKRSEEGTHAVPGHASEPVVLARPRLRRTLVGAAAAVGATAVADAAVVEQDRSKVQPGPVAPGAASLVSQDGAGEHELVVETRGFGRRQSRGEEALRRRLAAFEERMRRPDTLAIIGGGRRNDTRIISSMNRDAEAIAG